MRLKISNKKKYQNILAIFIGLLSIHPVQCAKKVTDIIQPEQTALFKELVEKNRKKISDVLGYDPEISYVEGKEKNARMPTLFFHGWGDNKKSYESCVMNYGLLSNAGIVFNFPDSGLRDGSFGALFKTSFGQFSDVMPALYALYLAQRAGFSAVNLCGHSRGAATIINLISILNQRRYAKELNKMGITSNRRNEMLNMVKSGKIVLGMPLKSVSIALEFKTCCVRESIVKKLLGRIIGLPEEKRCFIMKYICKISSYVARFADKVTAMSVNYLLLPFVMRYKPWREQAISSIKHWPSGLKTFIYYSKNDEMVSNKFDEEFVAEVRCLSENGDVTLDTESLQFHNDCNLTFLKKIKDFLQN